MIDPWFDLFYVGPLCRGANAYALYLAPDLCDTSAAELAARRAVVAAANALQVCACCGQPIVPKPPAPAANIAGEAPPSGWRDREPLL